MAKEEQQEQKKEMKQKAKTKKVVKKMFFEVFAPLISTKIQLYASSPQELENRTVKIDFTKSLRGKNLELKIRVKNENDKLIGIPESAKLVSSYVRKIVRKGTDYSEDSFEANCRDLRVRIKPLIVTRRRVSRTILAALRESAKKQLIPHLRTRNAEEIFSEIISNKLQKQLAIKLKKIYPLALCEIRMFEIIGPVKEGKEEVLKYENEDVSLDEEKE
jgi:ribosomal protein S3AE